MGKWGALAQKTYEDIEKKKIKQRKRVNNDCTAVIIDNIFKIKRRIGRG